MSNDNAFLFINLARECGKVLRTKIASPPISLQDACALIAPADMRDAFLEAIKGGKPLVGEVRTWRVPNPAKPTTWAYHRQADIGPPGSLFALGADRDDPPAHTTGEVDLYPALIRILC